MWRCLPEITLSAYASRDDRIRMLAAGFQIHVAKPIDLTELTAVANLAQYGARSLTRAEPS